MELIAPGDHTRSAAGWVPRGIDDSSCSNCQELKALERSQREADRAHEGRLRQLERDAERLGPDEIEELTRSRRSGGSSAKSQCGHMLFDSSCCGCRHYDYAQKAARAADRPADEFSKQAQSYADNARAAWRCA